MEVIQKNTKARAYKQEENFLKLENLIPLIKGIGKSLGRNLEIVLHDISKTESSIIAIENGDVTGRQEGSPSTDFLLEYIALQKESPDKYPDLKLNYLSKTRDGKNLKSSLILLRDSENKIVGAVCINVDLTDIEVSRIFLEDLSYIEKDEQEEKPEESFPNDVQEFLDLMVEKSLNLVNKPICNMNKDDKLLIMKYLYEHNIFNIKGAIEKLADQLNVSRYTIYNYLEEVKYK